MFAAVLARPFAMAYDAFFIKPGILFNWVRPAPTNILVNQSDIWVRLVLACAIFFFVICAPLAAAAAFSAAGVASFPALPFPLFAAWPVPAAWGWGKLLLFKIVGTANTNPK